MLNGLMVHFIEVACANLAFGVLGIVSLRRGLDFWLATILGQGVFMVLLGRYLYQPKL